MSKRRKPHVALGASCSWPGVGGFDTSYGREGLAYLRGRSQKDSWFAVVSAVMHAGQINYNAQQPIAERLLKESPSVVRDFRRSAEILEGAQDIGRVIPGLAIGEACMRKHCSTGACATHDGAMRPEGEELIECMRSTRHYFTPEEIDFFQSYHPTEIIGYKAAPGAEAVVDTSEDVPFNDAPREGIRRQNKRSLWEIIERSKDLQRDDKGYYTRVGLGNKTRNLLGEYLGCDNAVAVDRHVGEWFHRIGRVTWVQKIEITKRDAKGRSRGQQYIEAPVHFVDTEGEMRALRKKGVPAISSKHFGQPANFGLLKREAQKMARSCGVPPAELQVAAWAQGACENLAHSKNPVKGIYLGDGHWKACSAVPRAEVDENLSDAAEPIAFARPAKAERQDRFSCSTGYFGDAGLGAAGEDTAVSNKVKIDWSLPKAPAGEKWTYRFVGAPRAMRVLPRTEVHASSARSRLAPEQRVFMGRDE